MYVINFSNRDFEWCLDEKQREDSDQESLGQIESDTKIYVITKK